MKMSRGGRSRTEMASSVFARMIGPRYPPLHSVYMFWKFVLCAKFPPQEGYIVKYYPRNNKDNPNPKLVVSRLYRIVKSPNEINVIYGQRTLIYFVCAITRLHPPQYGTVYQEQEAYAVRDHLQSCANEHVFKEKRKIFAMAAFDNGVEIYHKQRVDEHSEGEYGREHSKGRLEVLEDWHLIEQILYGMKWEARP